MRTLIALLVLLPAFAPAAEPQVQPEECRLYFALLDASAKQLAARALLPAQAEALRVLYEACAAKTSDKP